MVINPGEIEVFVRQIAQRSQSRIRVYAALTHIAKELAQVRLVYRGTSAGEIAPSIASLSALRRFDIQLPIVERYAILVWVVLHHYVFVRGFSPA